MLATPLLPGPSFSPQQRLDETPSYRPAKDKEAFLKLMPPVEFVEGSSSGVLAVPEGKYEVVNESPRAPPHEESPRTPPPSAPATPQIPRFAPTNTSTPISANQKAKAKEQATPASSKSLYTGTIDTNWPRGISPVGAGLHNIGNTCFLNSALQCLLHTPPLLNILAAHNRTEPCRAKDFCMTCCLRSVANGSFYSQKRSFTPSAVTTKLHAIAKHLRRGRQEDSHEFLRYAIDALQKSCLVGYPPKIDPKLAETTWVHKIFGGKLRSRVTCMSCGYNSDTFDSILDLSIDIHGAFSVQQALKKFVAIDSLKGADKYKCDKCKRRVVAEKRFTIHEAPVVLTVHLKRFSPLGKKIGHQVHYDERLSLGNFMSDGSFGPTYSLYGVISHAGGGPNSGHYYAHVKAANGKWYEMNDDSVSPCSGAPTGLRSAYMLFYMQEKGQALQAAVGQPSKKQEVSESWKATSSNGAQTKSVAGSMNGKRKRTEKESEGERQTPDKRPFIGPKLPASTAYPSSSKDPQAVALQRKIEREKARQAQEKQAQAAPLSSLKKTNALSSLNSYRDDDDDEDDAGDDVGEKVTLTNGKAPEAADSPPSATASTSAPPPSSSPPAAPSPSPIPPSSFYGSAPPKGTKRKTPTEHHDEDDDGPPQTPKSAVVTGFAASHGSNAPKIIGVAGDPYDKTSGFFKKGKMNPNKYGHKKRRFGI